MECTTLLSLNDCKQLGFIARPKRNAAWWGLHSADDSNNKDHVKTMTLSAILVGRIGFLGSPSLMASESLAKSRGDEIGMIVTVMSIVYGFSLGIGGHQQSLRQETPRPSSD